MTMTLHTLGSEIRKEWLEHILPFWGGLKDETNGGFYGQVNADLKIDEQAAKGGIACSEFYGALAQPIGRRGTKSTQSMPGMPFNFSRATSLIANMADCIGW